MSNSENKTNKTNNTNKYKKTNNVKKVNSAKTVKTEKNDNRKKSRAVTRQESRENSIMEFKTCIDRILNDMINQFRAREMPPVDRMLLGIQINLMENLSNVLHLRHFWEKSRFRSSGGEFLGRDINSLSIFLFGEPGKLNISK